MTPKVLAGSIGEGLGHIPESGLRLGRSKMQRYVTSEVIEDRPGLDRLMQPFGVWHRLNAKIRLQNASQLLISDERLGLLPAQNQKQHYVALYAFPQRVRFDYLLPVLERSLVLAPASCAAHQLKGALDENPVQALTLL